MSFRLPNGTPVPDNDHQWLRPALKYLDDPGGQAVGGSSGVQRIGYVRPGSGGFRQVQIVGPSGKLGLWGASAVAQPIPFGTQITSGYVGGTSGALNTSTTGGVGTKAWSFPELVRELKIAGFISS